MNEQIKGEEIMGYWIAGILICRECIDRNELKRIGEEDILLEFNRDEGANHICSRCKKRI